MTLASISYNFSAEKNQLLIEERGISFEEVIAAIENGKLLDVKENTKQYPHQKIYVVEMNDYVYIVSFVRTNQEIFLKTIFPSRKLTKKYLNKGEVL